MAETAVFRTNWLEVEGRARAFFCFPIFTNIFRSNRTGFAQFQTTLSVESNADDDGTKLKSSPFANALVVQKSRDETPVFTIRKREIEHSVERERNKSLRPFYYSADYQNDCDETTGCICWTYAIDALGKIAYAYGDGRRFGLSSEMFRPYYYYVPAVFNPRAPARTYMRTRATARSRAPGGVHFDATTVTPAADRYVFYIRGRRGTGIVIDG